MGLMFPKARSLLDFVAPTPSRLLVGLVGLVGLDAGLSRSLGLADGRRSGAARADVAPLPLALPVPDRLDRATRDRRSVSQRMVRRTSTARSV